MATLDNSKIERLAANAVINAADVAMYNLRPNINKSDTGISFDGYIEVFNGKSETTKNWNGTVPVQVKGKEVEEFSSDKINFSLEMDHYRNFYKNSGVILFVVEVKGIRESSKTKIFYKQLLPLDLKQILDKYVDQKSRIVELRALEETDIGSVCRFYLEESKNQPLVLVEKSSQFKRDSGTLVLTSLTFDPNNEKNNDIFEHDFNFYQETEGILYPLQVGKLGEISSDKISKFEINNHIYFFQTQMKHRKGVIKLNIEKIVQITFDEKKQTYNHTLDQFSSLDKHSQVLLFLIDFFSGYDLTIDDNTFPNLYNFKSQLEPQLKMIRELYHIVTRSKSVMKTLNVDITQDLITSKKQNEETYKRLFMLNQIFIEKDYTSVKFPSPEEGRLVNFKIGKSINLVLLLQPDEEDKIIDLFSEEVALKEVMVSFNEEDITYPYPIYGLLSFKSLSNASNLNVENIKKAFENVNPYLNDTISAVTNNFCLECIKAYDISQNKNVSLLRLAKEIWGMRDLPDNEEKNVIDYINLMQIEKRLNTILNDDQEENLLKIKNNTLLKENPAIHFGINVLLNNWREAKYAFNFLNKKEQSIYKKYPIYTLFPKKYRK